MSLFLLLDLADRRTRRAFGVTPAWASESESEKPTKRSGGLAIACAVEPAGSLKLTARIGVVRIGSELDDGAGANSLLEGLNEGLKAASSARRNSKRRGNEPRLAEKGSDAGAQAGSIGEVRPEPQTTDESDSACS